VERLIAPALWRAFRMRPARSSSSEPRRVKIVDLETGLVFGFRSSGTQWRMGFTMSANSKTGLEK
jgi:hypothetical protein